MKVNELRIGNLYIDYNDEVKAVDLQFFNLLWLDVEVDEMIKEFLPINEKWLNEKLSSKKEQFGNINITSTCVIPNGYDTIGFYSDYHEDDIHFKLPKYVHQLQNLYFAITGQELTISE